MKQPRDRIIAAIDVDSAERAVALVGQLKDYVGVFKIGLELVNAAGVQVFETLRGAGAGRFFYDAKLHDIPNTVAGAMRSIARLGVWCVTVHAAGGSAMLRAAVEAGKQEADRNGLTPPKILAVTLLTSISAHTLHNELQVANTGVNAERQIASYVTQMARFAHASGCDGVIASPHEIETVRAAVTDPTFLIVTPGVRPAGSPAGDQARTMTPREAVLLGADYLVIGRPIVSADDPAAAAQQIAEEIADKS